MSLQLPYPHAMNNPNLTIEEGMAEEFVTNHNALNKAQKEMLANAEYLLSVMEGSGEIADLANAATYVDNAIDNMHYKTFYVDTSATPGGSGKSGSPFNSVIDAVMACKDGITNKIYLKHEQEHYLGDANQTSQLLKGFWRNTQIIFYKWGSGGTDFPTLVIPFHNHANGYSYSPLRIYPETNGNTSSMTVSGYQCNLKTIANTNPVHPSSQLLHGGYGTNFAFYWRGGSITLEGDTCLITPYVTYGHLLKIGLAYTTLAGDGNLVSTYIDGVPTVLMTRYLSRADESTAHIFSHLRTDRANLLTNTPDLTYLAETLNY